MTVVLAGIGADTTNLGALGRYRTDGTFDYVPIPEKTMETREEETLGSWPLRTSDGVAADLTNRIRPQPVQDAQRVVTGDSLRSWPVHRDPNFAALTYGEHRTSGYVSRLRTLESGDVAGFYAGLRGPEDVRAHRYLIGYFTVRSVTVLEPDTARGKRRKIFESHSQNAHAKRARNGHTPFLTEKTVVLVDGCQPGGLFERDPIRLSEYTVLPGNQRAGYYLRSEIAETFSVIEGGDSMGYKPAYRCGLTGSEFREAVGIPGNRSGSFLSADAI